MTSPRPCYYLTLPTTRSSKIDWIMTRRAYSAWRECGSHGCMSQFHPALFSSSYCLSLQCGHVACQTCLLALFSSALSRYRQDRLALVGSNTRVTDAPQYKCPECQCEVKRTPIEVYPLKDLAAFMARLKGETEENPQNINTTMSPFSEFFPC